MNNDLFDIANQVLKEYEIFPESLEIVQSGTIKTLFKLRYMNKTYCLKRLKQTYEKALFSVYAQIYVWENGGNVPQIFSNRNKSAITEFNNQLFVLYEWIKSSDLNFNNPSDLCMALKGLADFHKKSKGYIPPESSRISYKLGKYPEQYTSMAKKMEDWKVISKSMNQSAYLKSVDSMITLANYSLYLLKNSNYEKLISDSNYKVLNHQDYGKGNALLKDNLVYIIDLDGVTFDLPTRDLRKIIGKESERKGKWNKESINFIMQCYESINKITPDEKKILFIDLMYPHWFFGLIKNIFLNNKSVKAYEIEKISSLETSKVNVLNELLK